MFFYKRNHCSILSQFSSVAQSCPTPHDPMDCRTSSLPVRHQLPGACSNSYPSNCGCHPTISSSIVPFSSCLQSFPASWTFSNEWALCIRWPKYWSFSIRLSNEYSGLISFRIDFYRKVFYNLKQRRPALRQSFSITLNHSLSPDLILLPPDVIWFTWVPIYWLPPEINCLQGNDGPFFFNCCTSSNLTIPKA